MEIQREFEREIREKDRQHKNKEKNLTEYLRDEQKKVLDVWTELKRVRRQFVDLREQTERELDNQKEEITKLLKNLKINGIEGGGKVFTDEKIIFEIIRRIKDGKGGREIFDYEGKIKTESGEEINSELYKELIKKYEDVLERNIQFESSKDENARRVNELEAELRAAKEKLSGYQVTGLKIVIKFQNATRKIYEICSLNSSNEGTRSRSLSPTKINPFDAVRNVQKALQKRDNEIQQLGEKLRGIERLQIELNTKLIKNEETKRGLEREIVSMRRNIQELQIEKIAGEEKRKAREEIEQFKNDLESDYSNRIEELNIKIKFLQEEKRNSKNELNLMQQQIKDYEIKVQTLKQKFEEKEIKSLRITNDELEGKLKTQQARLLALENDFSSGQKEMEILIELNERLQRERQEIQKEKQDVDNELTNLKELVRKLEQELEKLRNENSTLQGYEAKSREEMDTQKNQINQLENDLKEKEGRIKELEGK
uniref:Uncharacterized protein n=1 Tax=Meloidogyne javanica TaxID=6303 RepID=A0A915LTJ8_MELJA